jgi:hypothetical protein
MSRISYTPPDQGGLPGLSESGRQEMISRSQELYNTLGPLIPPGEIAIRPSATASSQERAIRAFETPIVQPTENGTGVYQAMEVRDVQPGQTQFNVPSQLADSMRIAKEVCEKVKSANASAFDDPQFAANCGICHKPGKDSQGNPHLGGMLLTEQSKQFQNFSAGELAVRYNKVNYRPTLGECPPTMLSISKDQAIAKEERIQCQQKKDFSVKNCSQCFSDNTWDRVAPNTETINPTLSVIGNGYVHIYVAGTSDPIYKGLLKQNTTTQIPIDKFKENTIINISLRSTDDTGIDIYVAGYIQGLTSQGPFSMDIVRLASVDTISSSKPRLSKMISIDNFRLTGMRPGIGKSEALIQVTIPFTWVSLEEEASVVCNSPYVRTEAAANFLESDSCFKKGSGPGSYPLDCLQGKFTSVGCLPSGTAYPSTIEKGRAIAGNLGIGEIADNLYELSIQSATGRTTGGQVLTIPQWSESSLKCTGVAIESPCDRLVDGKISDDCMKYLYENRGAGKSIGATYTATGQYQSIRTQDNLPQFCTPEGTANPSTQAGRNLAGSSMGSIQSLKDFYNTIHGRANDNTLSDAERAEAIKQCYGAQLQKANTDSTSGSVVSSDTFPLWSAVGNVKLFGIVDGEKIVLRQAENVSDPLIQTKGLFKLKPGSCGKPGFISIVLANDPKMYIWWTPVTWKGIILLREPSDLNNQVMSPFRIDTCWRVVQSRYDGPRKNDFVSFESQRNPGQYLAIGPNGMYSTYARTPEEALYASFAKIGGLAQLSTSNEGESPAVPVQQWRRTYNGYDEGSTNISCFDNLSLDEAKAQCEMMPNCVSFSYSNNGGKNGCFKPDRAGYSYNNGTYDGYTKVTNGQPAALQSQRQGRCPAGMYQYGSHVGGFCCPVEPTNFDQEKGDFTVCPPLQAGRTKLNGKYICALDGTRAQGLPVCGQTPTPYTSPAYGGGGGGPFGFKCPGDAYITEIQGSSGQFYEKARVKCSDGTQSGQYGYASSNPFTSRSANGYTGVTIGAGQFTDSIDFKDGGGRRGGPGGGKYEANCPNGGKITGIYGRSGWWMDSFGIMCE